MLNRLYRAPAYAEYKQDVGRVLGFSPAQLKNYNVIFQLAEVDDDEWDLFEQLETAFNQGRVMGERKRKAPDTKTPPAGKNRRKQQKTPAGYVATVPDLDRATMPTLSQAQVRETH